MIQGNTKNENPFWRKWIINYSLGELIGIGIAASIGRFLFFTFPESSALSQSTLTVIILIIAGVAEGFILGYIQWKSLAKIIPDFTPMLWVFVTTFSALAGWLFILPPGVMFIAFLSKISLISTYSSYLYTMLVGAAFGGLIGIPQFFIIRKYFKNAVVWIVSNTIGWMFSFLIVYSALLLFQYTSSLFENFLLIALACILSGLVQGFVTGTSLHFLMSIRKKKEENSKVWKK
jgi:hypothetical protein